MLMSASHSCFVFSRRRYYLEYFFSRLYNYAVGLAMNFFSEIARVDFASDYMLLYILCFVQKVLCESFFTLMRVFL
jgi:hypothetical protein